MTQVFKSFEVDGDFVIAIVCDGQEEVHVAATIEFAGDLLILHSFHIHGPGKHRFGIPRLRGLAYWLKEQLGVQHLRIEGAARTSGARPGRIPRPLVF